MDINEISDVPTDAASESTFESEFDALSKIITDTKDDMHKLSDNDEVFKLDNDGLAIGDILDGSTDLENFIPTSNVDSDLQEVLGETFETSEDPSYKSIQNSLEDQTTAEKNDEIALPVESCVNNVLPIDDDSAQKSQSYPEDQPFLALEDRTCESLSGTGMETCQQPMEKIENSGNDNQEDLILSDYLSEFSENDHSKNIVDEKLDAVEESTVDCVATRSSENESADQTDFAQASSFPSVNPECSDIIFNNQVDDNLKKDPSIDTEEQQKDSKIEDLKTLLGEVKSCAKDNDIAELSNDPPIVQQTLESIEQDIICHAKQSEEMLVSNKSNYEEDNSCHAKQFSEEILISNENNDNEFMKENMQPTDEPNIDEIPTTVPLEKEKKMEEETSKDFQTANNLTGTTDLENVNEDKNENMLASDCQELVSESIISENFEAANTELKNVENDSVAETSYNIQSEIENKEHVENAENVNDQSTMESTPDPELEKQDNPTTETVFEEPSSVNTETEMPISLEKIEGNSSPSNGVEKEQPMSTVNEKDIKPVEQAESSLVTQDLSENIATLNDPLNDSIANITSAEVKEILDEKKASNTDEDVIEASCSEQESDSQVISNMLNETEKDLNSDLSNLLETKEAVSEDISNFGNSKILSDQNFQSLEEKSQDPLSVRDTVANQMDNEKSSPCEKADDITFGESSQSPTPMQNDKFISDLYDSCMPDDTSQFSNIEVENSKASADLGNAEPAVEIEDQELMETDALEENASELMFEEAQANKGSNEPPSEISELESAVKFLQESEQSTETLQVATAGEGNPSVFVAVEEGDCDNATEMASDLPEMTLDPIAISEAEIISEAAKLETERKEKLEQDKLKQVSEKTSDSQMDDEQAKSSALSSTEISDVEPSDKLVEALSTSAQDSLQVPITARLTSDYLPKSGVLDERYKEPLKLEIPESSKLVELPDNALTIHKQRLESPERQASSGEPKISDTPTKRDNSDKQQPMECENVGSPRIILKIAKSAIAECSEPRSPKSPKVRSSDSPNREDSPSSQKLGKIKLKLSKGGHPSIIPSGDSHEEQELAHKADDSRKSESPIGMKIKLSKSGDASIVQQDNKETAQETTTGKKQDSPSLGMKIKLSKSGDASIIQQDKPEHVDDDGTKRTESPIGMKIKLSKSGDASVISSGSLETAKESIDEPIKRTDSPIGVKIKLAKNKGGSASIISTENVEEVAESSTTKSGLGMKIKLSKSGDASVIHTSKDDVHEATEQHIGMKIKLSKTGDPSIIPSGYSREYEDIAHRTKHSKHKDHGASQRSKDDSHLEMKIKLSKTGHPTIVTSTDSVVRSLKAATPLQENDADIISFKKSHSDVTIEPIKSQSTETTMVDLHGKRKEISISPIESKKPKVDAGTKQMIPDVTLQPLAAKKEHHQKLVLDSNAGSISRQQMSVINQEISITPISATASGDSLMGEHLRNALNVPTGGSTPSSSDCEIIEAQPELIIVNENSNSSQDVMIIEEVVPPVKAPKKRGRPRRNALPAVAPAFQAVDPLSLEQPRANAQYPPQTQLQAALLQQVPPQHIIPPAGDGTERPRRTCRNQKSYAPPKRGRGRGRGKRKNEALDIPAKKPRMEQEFVGTEHTAKPVIALQKLPLDSNSGLKNSPELFKALNQPSLNQIAQQARSAEILQVPGQAKALSECEVIEIPEQSSSTRAVQEGGMEVIKIPSHAQVPSMHLSSDVQMPQAPTSKHLEQTIGENGAIVIKVSGGDEGKQSEEQAENGKESIQSNQNWLAPSIKKVSGEAPSRTETISSLTVIDEETRMSAESGSRSQTPARTMPAPGVADTLVNEESQNSVLSTATTESEKVKQPRNRRMEICLDADEGPFTVDRIAEYEWPPSDRINEPKSAITRGETFMVQEQISQYLGVKSFKRKYPDLKRRMVDMEERNFLRENALVSESMCDMGLTAVSSSEVLDIMCSDFPEQYEEYRKYVREKAAREHSKRQKELSAAANAERNRIDLAEMAMQSATSWNSGFNKARQDSRRCSLDLQTYTVHIPRQPFKYNPSRRGNNYPCALITGQYTDYYREYKPAELRYYPLNTVVYGPTRPNERKFDSQSEGSQSDSDSDSSSDDSSSTSSEGTQDTEGSQSTMDEVDMELALDPSIKCKMCSNHLNKNNRPETLIVCGTCNGNVHPSCIDLTLDMVPHIRAYAWQCTDCKTCAQCHDPADEDKMLFCDMCDRGYHIYCVGLRRVPQGRWHCQECAVCANCGSKEPGGANSDRNSVAQWQHEFKKGDKNTRVYVSTFCVPCSKMRGNQGNDN